MPLLTPEMKKALRRLQADELMTKKDLAKYLGVSESTAKTLTKDNLPRLLKLLEELDELFETVDTDSIALLCLRYVELLSIPDTAERTGLSNSQISTRTAKVMKNAKEIIIKA